jgi:hypothetical protein
MGDASTALLGSKLALGGVQTFTQARAIRAQASIERRQLEANRRLAELQAEDIMRRGEREAQEVRGAAARTIGAQRAALAAQGVELAAGTPLALQEETAALGAMDALTVRNNAFRQAFGFRVRAVDIAAQRRFIKAGARREIGATILTGGLGAVRDIAAFEGLRRKPGNGGNGETPWEYPRDFMGPR